MTRNIGSLGVTLVVALALGLAAAGGVGADVLTTEFTPAIGTGAQEGMDLLRVHGGEFKCTSIKYAATVSSLSTSSISTTPTYSGCTFIGLAASVNMNGCTLKFNASPKAGNTTLTEDVVCPEGKEITVTSPTVGAPKCFLHFPPQTGLGPASVANIGTTTTKEVTMSLAITNLGYSQTTGTAETGNCATADNTTNGAYTGKALITGENLAGTAHIGIFFS